MYKKIIVPKISRDLILKERKEVKQELNSHLERGDIVEIFNQMCKIKSIAYNNVANSLNPNSQFWSPRVIEFTKQYVEARKAELDKTNA